MNLRGSCSGSHARNKAVLFFQVGATGIEDLLQEDVVATIGKLREAGVIAWMLTGDKKETALCIGQACGLLTVSRSLCTRVVAVDG